MKRRYIAPFIAVAILSGCSTRSHYAHLKWTPEYLIGKTIEQDSDTTMNHFTFDPNGWLPATIGSKDGYTAAPLLRWSIDPEGRLIITDGDSINYPPLALIKTGKDALWVSLPSGEVLKFRILNSIQ